MAFSLSCRITVGELVLQSANSIEIVSSWKTLGDTCTVKIPSRGVLRAGSKLENVSFGEYFKTGTRIKVELGYDGKLRTEFEGYVAKILPKQPFELLCEDEIYQLNRSDSITKSYKTVKLKSLLEELVPLVSVDPQLPDITIENFLIERATKAQVLQELKEKYGLAVYFREGKLHAGLAYFEQVNSLAKLHLQKNVVSDELQYQLDTDVRLKVKVIVMGSDNGKYSFEIGDQDGEVRTLHYQYRGPLRKKTQGLENQLKEQYTPLAQNDLQQFKFTGYRGSLTAFGLPYVVHSQSVEVEDGRYSERKGSYLVDEVRTSWGTGGFRRQITLGPKV